MSSHSYEDTGRSRTEWINRPPTSRQKRFADAISKELEVYPEDETFKAYEDFISYYKNDFYDSIGEGRKRGRNG